MKVKDLLKYCVLDEEFEPEWANEYRRGKHYVVKKGVKLFVKTDDYELDEFEFKFVTVQEDTKGRNKGRMFMNLMCKDSELEEVIMLPKKLNTNIKVRGYKPL